jgi:LacI family transcriptional regulator
MSDLARRLGVSVATVSNALSGKGRVSPELAETIRRTAERAGYVPSHAGRALRTGKTGTIGLIVPDLSNPLFPTFAQAIERAAKRRGYAVLLADSLDDAAQQAKEISTLLARGADALIIIPRRGTQIDHIPVPLALLDSLATAGNTVASDHRGGGILIGQHLREQGHRTVLILAGNETSTVAGERVAGLREGLGPDVKITTLHSLASLQAGLEQGHKFEPGSATAIACAYDTLALGVLSALAQRGIKVPEDVSVTGFDDLIWGQISHPPLTTVRQNFNEIAEIAIGFVTGEIDRGQLVPVEMVMRSSTGAPAKVSSTSPLQGAV